MITYYMNYIIYKIQIKRIKEKNIKEHIQSMLSHIEDEEHANLKMIELELTAFK